MVTRGFKGRRSGDASRVPPGQSVVEGFPVLSIGPTPKPDLMAWRFFLKDGPRLIKTWDWESFCALERTEKTVDIHCVTTWSKLDTVWRGVTIDAMCADAGIEPPTAYALAHAADDYSTNVPVADLLGGKAMIATHFGGSPLMREHGGPARLLVPHLYFWKSAKWVTGLQFTKRNEAGFWELRGYHMRGDPFQSQRYGGL